MYALYSDHAVSICTYNYIPQCNMQQLWTGKWVNLGHLAYFEFTMLMYYEMTKLLQTGSSKQKNILDSGNHLLNGMVVCTHVSY